MVTSFKIGQGFVQSLKLSGAFPFLPVFFLGNNKSFLFLHYCLISVCSQACHELVTRSSFQISADEYQQHWWWGGSLGWAVLVQEPCLLWKLSTLLRLKRERGKKKKGKRVEIYFYFEFFLILFGACSQLQAGLAKNIYLSFYLKEVFFKSLLGFIFLFLFTFTFLWGVVCWVFSSSHPTFFCFILFCFFYQKIGKPNVLISLFPTNPGFGQCCFAAHAMPRVTQFQLRAFFKAEHLQAKKSLEKEKTQWLQTRLLLSINFLV